MKKLITILFLAVALFCYGQRPSFVLPISSTGYDWTQPGGFSGGLFIPSQSGLPSFHAKAWKRAGSMNYDSLNKVPYIWDGTKWDTLNKGGNILGSSDTVILNTRYQRTVANIAALRALDKTDIEDGSLVYIRGYYSNGDGGEGQFILNKDSSTADNSGMIIGSGSGGRFYRLIPGNVYTLEMFGAKGDGSNDYASIRRFLDWVKSHAESSRLNLLGKFYTVLQTLVFDAHITVEGRYGYASDNNSGFISPYENIGKGFQFPFPYTPNFNNVYFKCSLPDELVFDTSRVGVEITTVGYFYGCTFDGFAGNGVTLHGDAGGSPFTNVSQSYFVNCRFLQNRGYGIKVYGGDANIIKFINCQYTANGGAGKSDDGFLGDAPDNDHAASNSAPDLPWQRGLCKHGGVVYYAKNEGLLDEPGVGTDWEPVSDDRQGWIAYGNVKEYDEDYYYLSSGPTVSDRGNELAGQNQQGAIINPYSEGDQAPVYWGRRTLGVGGIIGSGFAKIAMPWIGAYEGYVYARGLGLMTNQKFVSGTIDPTFINNNDKVNAQFKNIAIVGDTTQLIISSYETGLGNLRSGSLIQVYDEFGFRAENLTIRTSPASGANGTGIDLGGYTTTSNWVPVIRINNKGATATWPELILQNDGGIVKIGADTAATLSDVRAGGGGGGSVTASSTTTFTNKRWTARVGSTTSSATPTINTDNYDVYKLTAQAANITSFTTNLSGTPVDGDILEIQITGTATRTISMGSSFVSSTIAIPGATDGINTLTMIFQWYTTSSYGNNKWICVNTY